MEIISFSWIKHYSWNHAF